MDERLEASTKQTEQTDKDYHQSLFDYNIRSLGLNGLIEYLESLSDRETMWALGRNAQDFYSTSEYGPTSFLTGFNHQIPLFRETHHQLCRFDLMHIALHVNKPGYSVTDVLKLLKEMQISAITVPASIFECVFVTRAN